MSIRQLVNDNTINKKKLVHSKHGWLTYSSLALAGMAVPAIGAIQHVNADEVKTQDANANTASNVMSKSSDVQSQTVDKTQASSLAIVDNLNVQKTSDSQQVVEPVKVSSNNVKAQDASSSIDTQSKTSSAEVKANQVQSANESVNTERQSSTNTQISIDERSDTNKNVNTNDHVSSVSKDVQSVASTEMKSSPVESSQTQASSKEQSKIVDKNDASGQSDQTSKLDSADLPAADVDIDQSKDGFQTIPPYQSGATQVTTPTSTDWDNYNKAYQALPDVTYTGTIHYMNGNQEVGTRQVNDKAKQGDTDVIYNYDVLANNMLRQYGWQVSPSQVIGNNDFVFDPSETKKDWYINVVHPLNDGNAKTGFVLPELSYQYDAKNMDEKRVYSKSNDLQKEDHVSYDYVDQNKEHNRTINAKVNFIDPNGNVVSTETAKLDYNQAGQVQLGVNTIQAPNGYELTDGDLVDAFNSNNYKGINVPVKVAASTLSTNSQDSTVLEPSGVLVSANPNDPESVKEFQEAWKDYQALPDEQVKLDIKYVDDDGNTVGTREVIDNKKQGDHDALWIRDIADSDALNKEGWHLDASDKDSWDDNKSGTVIIHVHKILGQDAKTGFTLPTVTYSYDSNGEAPYYRSNDLYGSMSGGLSANSPIQKGHELVRDILDQGPALSMPVKDKNFVDQSGKTVGTFPADKVYAFGDACVNYDAVKVQAPSGYVFKDNGKSVGYTTPDATTLAVVPADSSNQTGSSTNPSSNVNGLDVEITYQTSDGKKVGSKTFNFADAKSPDAENQFETKGATENTIKQYIPSGYQFVRWDAAAVPPAEQINPDGTVTDKGNTKEIITVIVEPTSSSNQTGSSSTPSSDDIQVTINYKDGSNTIKTANEMIKSGDTLDVMKDMPSGYQPTSDFKPGNLNIVNGKAIVDVPVEKAPTSNSQPSGNTTITGNPVDGNNQGNPNGKIDVTINYKDGSNTIKTANEQVDNGANIDVSKDCPSGYEVDSSYKPGSINVKDGKATIDVPVKKTQSSDTGSSSSQPNNGTNDNKIKVTINYKDGSNIIKTATEEVDNGTDIDVSKDCPSGYEVSKDYKPGSVDVKDGKATFDVPVTKVQSSNSDNTSGNTGSSSSQPSNGTSTGNSDKRQPLPVIKPGDNTNTGSSSSLSTSVDQADKNQKPSGSIDSNNADVSKTNGSETDESKASEQPSLTIPKDVNDATNADIYPGEGIIPGSNDQQVSRGDLSKPQESQQSEAKQEKNDSTKVQTGSSQIVNGTSNTANAGTSYTGVDQEGRSVEVEKQTGSSQIVETHYDESVVPSTIIETQTQVGNGSVSENQVLTPVVSGASQIGSSKIGAASASSDQSGELPQTGDNDASKIAALGLMTASLGLIGLKRKKN